ncbi:uncharacterized protein Obp51a [Drosophila takahashii]|uniref:uncharacterized protein Obp51a n=1 Tax=Drosophila takahashii TaxID=29030 RepID=UPI001CF8209B|nr:uncharacterized protein LOC108069616 [Drosophila takahashii]
MHRSVSVLKMKVLIALVVLMSLGPLASAIFKHLADECIKKHGITPYLIENNPTSSQVKCFYYCQLEKLEILANGVVNPFDVSVLNVTEKNYAEYGIKIKLCLSILNHNKCELGYMVFQCLKRHLDKLN